MEPRNVSTNEITRWVRDDDVVEGHVRNIFCDEIVEKRRATNFLLKDMETLLRRASDGTA